MRDLRGKDHQVSMGTSNAFLPDSTRFSDVPGLILLYIDAHKFRPPEEFQAAVMKCPPLGSMDNFRGIRKAGLKSSIT
jgi:hypothetical protein